LLIALDVTARTNVELLRVFQLRKDYLELRADARLTDHGVVPHKREFAQGMLRLTISAAAGKAEQSTLGRQQSSEPRGIGRQEGLALT
jgi:hypothetical protein